MSECCNGKRTDYWYAGYLFEFGAPPEPAELEGEEWRDVERTVYKVSSFRARKNSVSVASRGAFATQLYTTQHKKVSCSLVPGEAKARGRAGHPALKPLPGVARIVH